METLKKGSKGAEVARCQIMLNLCLPETEPLIPDGDFGAKTEAAILRFFKEYLNRDDLAGQIDSFFYDIMKKVSEKRKKFFIVLDAGHGGLDPQTGKYTTPPDNGKRYRHKGATDMHQGDTFLEGVENRIIAERAAAELRRRGYLVVFANHPFLDLTGGLDNAGELTRRPNVARPYLEAGFYGYYHSLHSNAASEDLEDKNGNFIRKRTQAELNAIRGLICYTAPNFTNSDHVSRFNLQQWQKVFGADMVREADKALVATFESDYEKNLAVLFHSEKLAKNYPDQFWAALLDEFDFFTSLDGARWIMLEETRKKRVDCIVATAEFVYNFKPNQQ